MRIRFGPFTVDLDTRQLTKDRREVHLEPKAFALLEALVTERPKALSKTALHQQIWPETFVAEGNLASLVAEIRAALGDQARSPRFVRTVHGFGYAFCAEATTSTGPRQAQATPTSWLEWGQRRFPLAEADHVIGRDPDVEIRLDAATVSRRHARLVVTADGALLEDCGSKNGTFRGGSRVTEPVHLSDGDAIHIGSVLVTYHVRTAPMSTETQTQPAQ